VLISGHGLFIVIVALALDALIGDPDWLWRRLTHPVALIGAGIERLDRMFNREDWSAQQRKAAGVASTILLVVVSALIGLLLEKLLLVVPMGSLVLALMASVFLAQRSLYEHVAQVRDAFAEGGLDAARESVSMIVGRDPQQLDEAGVCRAAIESCAENFSDGVVAPVFWLALLGLPGLIAYKAINTADSMIGHRSERYESFGWAAARLDDLVNLVPARLSALLLALAAPVAGGSIKTSLEVVKRDASNHRSPNAGWPESAVAGALGLALVGPRRYGTMVADDPFLNAEASKEATPKDIGRALDLVVAACLLEAVIYAALVLVA
jgi:adenosylcobinamide-phosphate synthase